MSKTHIKDKLVILISVLVYLFINVLFVDKYTMRITEWHYLCDIIYIVFGVIILVIPKLLQTPTWKYRTILGIGGTLYILGMAVIQYHVDPITVNVDRWSAIHNFLYNLFHGIYPYAAQTHLGGYGSPFPIWQILHIPFYLLGNVGLSFFAALVLFLYYISTYDSHRTATIALSLIAFSPAINYEIIVRSDLFSNFLIICALCRLLQQKKILLKQHTYALGVITGLCASTRLTAVIPLALLYGYEFLQIGWRKQLIFIITVFATFMLTFLPFILWNGNHLFFFEYNPFILQTRQGNPFIFIFFAFSAIVFTIYKKNHLQHFNLYAGGLLTFLVIITFTYNMISSDNYNLYSSAYDITYFNMALPFYIYEIALPSALYSTTYYDENRHP